MRISDWSSDVCSSDLRRLVAMAGAEFRHAQRQVAVAGDALLEDLDVPGAVHRLHRQDAILGLGDEHVLVELLPVAGRLPEGAVNELWRLHLGVAGRLPAAAPVGLDGAVERPALGMRSEEHTSELQSLMRISYAVF